MPSPVRLAMAQMLVEGGRKEANLARACARIAEAAAAGAQIIVLPEALDLGWTHPSALTDAEPVPGGAPCERLRDAAARHGLFVCAGSTELADDKSLFEKAGRARRTGFQPVCLRASSPWHHLSGVGLETPEETGQRHCPTFQTGSKVFNAAVLIGPDGGLLQHHRKLNELEIGRAFYARGDRLGVAGTPFGRIGMMICADAFAPGQVVSRTLGLMGAELILSPCAWAVPVDHDNASEPYGQLWRDNHGPVARDFGLWIAGVSNVGPITGGPWIGRRCIGNSLLVGPDGEPALTGPYGADAEALLLADLPLGTRA
ncbi:MAG: carbon-nitrogen hydrolase family protein [Verrucomicrobiota bacterium]